MGVPERRSREKQQHQGGRQKQTRIRTRDRAPVALCRDNIFLRDREQCQFCGRHISQLRTFEILTKDHVLPRSRGGRDTWENLVTACNTCNQKKRDRTPEEAGMPLLRVPFAPLRYQVPGAVVLQNKPREFPPRGRRGRCRRGSEAAKRRAQSR